MGITEFRKSYNQQTVKLNKSAYWWRHHLRVKTVKNVNKVSWITLKKFISNYDEKLLQIVTRSSTNCDSYYQVRPHGLDLQTIALQLEWKGTYVSKEDSECWLIFFRMFVQILENKNLFQILG